MVRQHRGARRWRRPGRALPSAPHMCQPTSCRCVANDVCATLCAPAAAPAGAAEVDGAHHEGYVDAAGKPIEGAEVVAAAQRCSGVWSVPVSEVGGWGSSCNQMSRLVGAQAPGLGRYG